MCERNTEWVLDRLIRHSKCSICGADSKFSKRVRILDRYGELINTNDKTLKQFKQTAKIEITEKIKTKFKKLNTKLYESNIIIKKLKNNNKQLGIELKHNINTIKQLKKQIIGLRSSVNNETNNHNKN